MHKIAWTAVASMIAISSLDAAEQTASSQHAGNESLAADAGPTASGEESSNRYAIGAVSAAGSMSSSAAAGTVLSPPGMSAPAFVPVTPFASQALGGHAMNGELQEQMRELHEREQKMLQNPEYRDLLRARLRVTLGHNHPHLSELLQISKEQADQLLDLLAEQQIREQTAIKPPLPNQGDAAALEDFMERIRERQRANEAELIALLGASKFQEWQEYEQSAMARFQVQVLQQSLPADARLRPDQLRPLVSAIAREQRAIFEERARSLRPGELSEAERQKRMQESPLQLIGVMNQRMLAATASILSPRQLEHFEAMLQQELDGQSPRRFFFEAMVPVPPSSSLTIER